MNPQKAFDYRALFDLSRNVALVVGGGSGIGEAGAEGMAAHGAQLLVADVNADDAACAELDPPGVRANALAPGCVVTPLTKPIISNPAWNDAYAKRCAFGRWAAPEEMAGPIVFLASDASSYLTGTIIFADAGWTAIDGRFEPQLK